jgi:hypothetical protein
VYGTSDFDNVKSLWRLVPHGSPQQRKSIAIESFVSAEKSVEEMRELHAKEVQELNDLLEAAQKASQV